MSSLEYIGFYTLSDQRAETASHLSRLMRCELVLSSRCNFKCPYCRSVGGEDIAYEEAARIVREWASDKLFAIRFSGGEPMMYPRLLDLVKLSKELGIERIAISTNGSFPLPKYLDLIEAGVNDFSISLDACCAEDGDHMAGDRKGAWEKVVNNIKALSALTYVTVGVVLTQDNIQKTKEIIEFAHSLGVADIRVIPAAQNGNMFQQRLVPNPEACEGHPILNYRMKNYNNGKTIRGLDLLDNDRCPLVLDDIAVCGEYHYPCIIHMRENGQPIGKMTTIGRVRRERLHWFKTHDTHKDPICRNNCLDVCRDYNNKCEEEDYKAKNEQPFVILK